MWYVRPAVSFCTDRCKKKRQGTAFPAPLAYKAANDFVLRNENHLPPCLVLHRLQKGAQRMAIYHCSIKIISRGKGKSAVAAAAYRAGEKIINQYDGIEHDYTCKGGVVHTEILLPENTPLNMQTEPFCETLLRKSKRRKTRSLRGKLNLPCLSN